MFKTLHMGYLITENQQMSKYLIRHCHKYSYIPKCKIPKQNLSLKSHAHHNRYCRPSVIHFEAQYKKQGWKRSQTYRLFFNLADTWSHKNDPVSHIALYFQLVHTTGIQTFPHSSTQSVDALCKLPYMFNLLIHLPIQNVYFEQQVASHIWRIPICSFSLSWHRCVTNWFSNEAAWCINLHTTTPISECFSSNPEEW
jgi:hypothetical protein